MYKRQVVDGILLDEEEEIGTGPAAVDEVGYYFDILIDSTASPFLRELERKERDRQRRREKKRARRRSQARNTSGGGSTGGGSGY